MSDEQRVGVRDQCTEVVLHRKGLADYLHSYQIELDGVPIAEIGRGERCHLRIPPGSHELRLRLEWCRSPAVEFRAEAGRQIHFECGNRVFQGLRAFLALLWVVFLPHRYLYLTRADV